MKGSQLERLYRDAMGRLKEQIKKQDEERLEQAVKRAVREQMLFYEQKLRALDSEQRQELSDIRERYEKKLQSVRDGEGRERQESQALLRRELRLAQEELERITDQALSLRRHIDQMTAGEKEQKEQKV